SQPQLAQVVGAAADTARRQSFSQAFQRSLLFEIGVFLASFLLVFLLPQARGEEVGHAEAAAPV
ncbi:MAG: hypothetical protein ACJ782_13345, partial [Actinomycetota bacterium]